MVAAVRRAAEAYAGEAVVDERLVVAGGVVGLEQRLDAGSLGRGGSSARIGDGSETLLIGSTSPTPTRSIDTIPRRLRFCWAVRLATYALEP